MKTHKTCGVVMLPTKEKATDNPFSVGITLCNDNQLRIGNPVGCTESRQHLYITSDEESNEKDLIIDLRPLQFGKIERVLRTRREENAITTEKGKVFYKDQFAKIIATTDPTLKNSTFYEIEGDQSWQIAQVDQSFILHYMSEYNKGNKIEKVEVEYAEYDHDEEWSEIGGAYETCRERLKINPDNTINIKPIKESWSREEVVEILHRFRKETYNGYSAQKWINQNL